MSAPGHSPRRVLVVDDQPDERAIQSAMLGHLGYEVHEAADGETAVHRARELGPDIIVLDVAMPRMDGLAVCRELRADTRTARIPVLLLTASVAGDLQTLAAEAGAVGILSKPVEPHAVAAEIRRLIGPPSSAGAEPHG
jgi:CheY-like chemotaxis protein